MTDALPIIDVTPLEEDEARLERAATAIGAACRSIGFFYAVYHGVPRALIDKAFARLGRSFALPLAAKEAIGMDVGGGNRSHSALLREALDPKQGPDLKETLNISLDLEPDDPNLLADKPFRALNAWPDLSGFRATMLTRFNTYSALADRIHRAFGQPLGFFEDKFDRPMATLRLLRYSAPA